MDIPWAQPVQLNDKDRGRLIDLTLGEALDEAATFDPARLAIAEIHCDPAIETSKGARNALNADEIAQLIQLRRSSGSASPEEDQHSN